MKFVASFSCFRMKLISRRLNGYTVCCPARKLTVLHPRQGGLLVRADSDLDEASEVEEERERPVLGSESESSTYGLSKKKKKKPKEKKEKKPRKKKRDEDDEDEDEDDGNMKVRPSSEIPRFQKNSSFYTSPQYKLS